MSTLINDKVINPILEQSLRFALTPPDTLRRHGRFGLSLMKKLAECGYHLPLFAAVDVVCTFFMASQSGYNFLERLPTKHTANNGFKSTYANDYQTFVNSIWACEDFRRIGNRWRVESELGKAREYEILYFSVEAVLIEIATTCPFIKIIPIFHSEKLSKIRWDELAIPDRLPFDTEEELKIVTALRLNGRLSRADFQNDALFAKLLKYQVLEKVTGSSDIVQFDREFRNERSLVDRLVDMKLDEADRQLVSFHYRQTFYLPFDKEEKFSGLGVLAASCFTAAAKTHPISSDEQPRDKDSKADDYQTLILNQHLFDHKLVDLYHYYHNKFEPSEALRHNIAELMTLHRNAIDQSIFYTAYTDQGRRGLPNPSYLIHGWKLFFYWASRGEPVFIDNEPPVLEQDDISIRLFIVEELTAMCTNLEEGGSRNFPHHLSVHKLVALLIIQDIVKFLGGIPEFDVDIQLYSYRAPGYRKADGSDAMQIMRKSMKNIVDRAAVTSPFLHKDKDIQRIVLMESSTTEVDHSSFESVFFDNYGSCLSSSLTSTSKTSFNVFFARGEAYFESGASATVRTAEEREFYWNTEDSRLKSSLLGGANSRDLARLLSEPTSFICETSDCYRFTTPSEFDPAVHANVIVERNLSGFLTQTREYILGTLVDQALRLIREDRP